MGSGGSKKPKSPPPAIVLQRQGPAADDKVDTTHTVNKGSSQPAPDRKFSCLSVLDVPARRLSLSIPDAGKTGDTISIKTTNIHVESEDNVVQPVENVVVSSTNVTASEASLSDSSIKNSECETKSMENGKTEQEPAGLE